MYGRTSRTTARLATPRRSSAYQTSIPSPIPTSGSRSKHRVQATISSPAIATRYRLAIAAAALGVLTVVVAFQLLGAYGITYTLFDNIGQTSSLRVDTSEQALQHIARVGTAIADLSNPAGTDQDQQTALNTAYANFALFRADLFTLHTDLDSAEQTTFSTLENAVYNQFWPQMALAVAAQQSRNETAVHDAYVKADSYLEGDITLSLRQIEIANFAAMKAVERQAGGVIIAQAILLGFLFMLLACSLTVLSFWLRFRVRRLLTPGIDGATVLAWVLMGLTMSQLLGLPDTLRGMVEDAYYSVTASARVLAIADQGNRAESASLLDSSNALLWQQRFDNTANEIELRMCGVPGCLQMPFTKNNQDQIASLVLRNANSISPAASASIGDIVPLVANVTYAGEAQTLEIARKAYLDYLTIDGQLRSLIKSNQLSAAWALDTGIRPGQSDEAFGRFSTALEHEQLINREVFDNLRHNVQTDLPANRSLYALGGSIALIGLLAAGTIQRFREL